VEIIFVGLFWLTIGLIIHTYINYPLTLKIINILKGSSINERPDPTNLPTVSILISAYNEEKVIAERIENIKNLDYDFGKVELIIGSDCSTDGTNNILIEKSREYEWVKFQTFSTRRGKANVLNDLIQSAKNEILVFTDANSNFEKRALLNLVSNFTIDEVGGVCGRLNLEEPNDKFEGSNREKLYWKYETHLKKSEGDLGILIAANGGIYAIRKKLFVKFPVNEAITDDLYQTLAVLGQGYKFLFKFDAIANEDVSKEIKTEFNRKVRFAATNFQTLKSFKKLLFNRKPLLSYALWSHKIIRWFVPLLLVILFIANLLLVNSNQFFYISATLQIIFYSFGIVGFILSLMKISIPPFSIVYYYILSNVALLIGLIKFLKNKHSFVWDSTPR